jgi:hypothetical protein
LKKISFFHDFRVASGRKPQVKTRSFIPGFVAGVVAIRWQFDNRNRRTFGGSVPNLISAPVRPLEASRRSIPVRNSRQSVYPAGAIHSAVAVACELLEPRQLLSTSMNSAGWTVVTPSPGARVIYVSSSSGNDKNGGLSPSSPVASLAKGISLIRNNSADELLLKKGDTWNSNFGYWSKMGISASDPIVIGAYGSGPRPTLDTGNQSAFTDGGNTLANVDIIGLKMVANARGAAGPNGINVDSKVDNFLIENCDIQDYGNDIVFQEYYGPMDNITIRRSIIADAWSGNGSHSQGLFCDGCHGITLEQNVFDHNGWNLATGGWMTIFNHDVYITADNSGLVAIGNTFSNASNFGLEARCGGTIENNLFYNDADGLDFGLVDGSPLTPGGVSGTISGNVFSGSHTIGGVTYGGAVMIGNVNSSGLRVTNNVFTNNSVGKVAAIQLSVGAGNPNASSAVGLNNITISGNVVYKWYEGLYIAGGMHPGGSGEYAINNVKVSGNTFAVVQNRSNGANYSGVYVATSAAVTGMSDPNRTLDTYAASVGESNAATFINAEMQLSDTNWLTKLTAAAADAYVDAGFW